MNAVILLRLLFAAILVGMLAMIGWASWLCPLFAIPGDVRTHPWFLTTLLDAYLAFIAVFLWVAWKENSLGARVLWFIAIMLWGNVAIALYFLRELFILRPGDSLQPLWAERRPGHLLLPLALTLTAAVAYVLGTRGG